jgi:hypothetical protein
MTPVYKKLRLECRDPDCGWRGVAHQEITETITPSQKPNPEVRLAVDPKLREVLRMQIEPG